MRKINSAKRQIELGADRIKILWSDAISRIKASCSTRVCVFFSARPHTTTNPLGAHPSAAFYFNNHCAIQLTSETEISGPVWQGLSDGALQFNPIRTAARGLINSMKKMSALGSYQFTRNTQLGVY
jgi:hypothetical protein